MKFASINGRLLTVVTLVIVLSMAGILIYVQGTSSRMALEMQKDAIEQLGQNTAQSLDNYLEGAVSLATSLSKQRNVKNVFMAGFPVSRTQRVFEDFLEAYPDYWAMFVFDRTGKVLAGGNAKGTDLTGADRAGRNYVQAIVDGADTFVTPTVLKSKSGGGIHILGAAAAVKDTSGSNMGGVAVFPKWDIFTERFIDPITIGETGYAFVFNPKGRLMAHGRDRDLVLEDLSDLGFVQKALERKDGFVDYLWEGREKIMGVTREERTGWLVCVSAYVSELEATANEQFNRLLVAGVLAVLLAAGAIGWISRRMITKPVEQIEDFSRRVAGGDYSTRLEGSFKFELGQLADHLRDMVEAFKRELGFSRGLQSSLTTACLVMDRHEKLTFVNQEYLDLFGKPGKPGDYQGMTLAELFYGDANKETVAGKAMSQNRSFRDMEMETKAQDGSEVFVRYDVAPLQDLDGNLIGAFAMLYDLTTVKANEKALAEKNEVIAEAAKRADDVSNQVVSGAEELGRLLQEASEGAENQRGLADSTATAMEEMNATVMEVAKNASGASELAQSAMDKARNGSDVVSQVVSEIKELNTSSKELAREMGELGEQAEGIGQIIDVINDIADQTNLLALNAAIEAARAGDAGRGFAVVADEVRKLAEKTMDSTKQVAEYIQAIQTSAKRNIQATESAIQRIEGAADKADESGKSLAEIVDMVERTADQIQAIAASSEQQSAASEEINRSTDEVNRIAGETAESMNRARQSVEELERVATELREAMDSIRS